MDRDDDVVAVRLEIVGRGSGQHRRSAEGSLFVVDRRGGERRIATWTDHADAADRDVELQRSPTHDHVAVRVDRRTRTFDVASGRLFHDDTGDAPEPADDPLVDLAGVAPILIWGTDGAAVVRTPSYAETIRAAVGPGVEIVIRGPVEDEPGEATSNTSNRIAVVQSPRTDVTRQAVVAAASEELRGLTEAVSRPLAATVEVVSAAGGTIVQNDTGALDSGLQRLVWPPVVGPRGVLLRRARIRIVSRDPGDLELVPTSSPYSTITYSTTETEVLTPWLIDPSGTVRTLPFELGNGPLTTLPDGRFLLPCWQPMWWDGGNEPLSALSDDGITEPLRYDGRPLTPIAAVRAVAPDLVPAEDPADDLEDDFDGWRVTGARPHDDGLLLAPGPEDPRPASPWLLVALPLDGTACGVPRLIASGVAPANGLVQITV